jgi:hypothetical protein
VAQEGLPVMIGEVAALYERTRSTSRPLQYSRF